MVFAAFINKPGKYSFVFHAAAKVSDLFLNDYLSKGSDFYNPLLTVLSSFLQIFKDSSVEVENQKHTFVDASEERMQL